jgi:hypothetical protein
LAVAVVNMLYLIFTSNMVATIMATNILCLLLHLLAISINTVITIKMVEAGSFMDFSNHHHTSFTY